MYQDLSTCCDWLVKETHCRFANQVTGKLGTLLFKKRQCSHAMPGFNSFKLYGFLSKTLIPCIFCSFTCGKIRLSEARKAWKLYLVKSLVACNHNHQVQFYTVACTQEEVGLCRDQSQQVGFKGYSTKPNQ